MQALALLRTERVTKARATKQHFQPKDQGKSTFVSRVYLRKTSLRCLSSRLKSVITTTHWRDLRVIPGTVIVAGDPPKAGVPPPAPMQR